MPTIRIPQERWEEVWFALVSSGPISRVSMEPIYLVSDRQVRMLRQKKLPFQVISNSKGRAGVHRHGGWPGRLCVRVAKRQEGFIG